MDSHDGPCSFIAISPSLRSITRSNESLLLFRSMFSISVSRIRMVRAVRRSLRARVSSLPIYEIIEVNAREQCSIALVADRVPQFILGFQQTLILCDEICTVGLQFRHAQIPLGVKRRGQIWSRGERWIRGTFGKPYVMIHVVLHTQYLARSWIKMAAPAAKNFGQRVPIMCSRPTHRFTGGCVGIV